MKKALPRQGRERANTRKLCYCARGTTLFRSTRKKLRLILLWRVNGRSRGDCVHPGSQATFGTPYAGKTSSLPVFPLYDGVRTYSSCSSSCKLCSCVNCSVEGTGFVVKCLLFHEASAHRRLVSMRARTDRRSIILHEREWRGFFHGDQNSWFIKNPQFPQGHLELPT